MNAHFETGEHQQDAQKGRGSHPPNPGAPRRAVPQARPQRAKRRGGTYRTSCGPFAPRMDLGERISPSSASDLRKTLIEPLREARTKLANFFSILLNIQHFPGHLRAQVRKPLFAHAPRNRHLGMVLVMVHRQHNRLVQVGERGCHRHGRPESGVMRNYPVQS